VSGRPESPKVRIVAPQFSQPRVKFFR